jgi:DNA polymerase-3 subunit alpha
MVRIGAMVSTAQHGMSKKSGKPYAMITLEDLHGTFQMLLMNENYDRFKDVVVAGAPLMIVGEVNNSEDKPKLFPTEIFPLEDAVKKFTKKVHIRMYLERTQPEHFDQAFALTKAHPGRVPLFIHLKTKSGEWVSVEANQRFSVNPSPELQAGVRELFGQEAWHVTVDLNLPERVRKPWENRGNSGNGGGEGG